VLDYDDLLLYWAQMVGDASLADDIGGHLPDWSASMRRDDLEGHSKERIKKAFGPSCFRVPGKTLEA
jgi:hypothetical protein